MDIFEKKDSVMKKSITKKTITTKGVMLALVMIFLFYAKTQAQISVKDTASYLTDTVANFDQLIGKFKGNVVFVDIWATWCGPCRHELEQQFDINDFAQYAAKNNVIVLYICCDKNSNSWQQYISDHSLKGYHILINKGLNHDLHARF